MRVGPACMAEPPETVIRPRTGWRSVDLSGIFRCHEILSFLIWRDLKIRYRQTVLGVLWALLQPFLGMVIFTVFFNRLAGIESDGPPYPLFAFAGLIPWTFFANALTASSNSLVGNQQLISKAYFPRVFIPLGAIGGLSLDLFLGLLPAGALMLYYRWTPSPCVVWLPLFVGGAFVAAAGAGMTLSALNVRFRDVKYAVPFLIQMGIFLTPVIYPAEHVPEKYHLLLGLNPMTGVVEGFRHAILGTPLDWGMTAISLGMGLFIFVGGFFLFHKLERAFADVI